MGAVSHAETVAADANQAASQTAKAVHSTTKAATTSMQKAVKKAADTKEQHPKATDEAVDNAMEGGATVAAVTIDAAKAAAEKATAESQLKEKKALEEATDEKMEDDKEHAMQLEAQHKTEETEVAEREQDLQDTVKQAKKKGWQIRKESQTGYEAGEPAGSKR